MQENTPDKRSKCVLWDACSGRRKRWRFFSVFFVLSFGIFLALFSRAFFRAFFFFLVHGFGNNFAY